MHRSNKGSSTLEGAIIFPFIMFLLIFIIFFAFYMYEKNDLVAKVNLVLTDGLREQDISQRIPADGFYRSLVVRERVQNYFLLKKYFLTLEYESSLPYFKGGLKIKDEFEKKLIDPPRFIRNYDFAMETAKDIKELIDLE